MKKRLEDLCLMSTDAVRLFEVVKAADPHCNFKDAEEFAASLANPDTLQLVRVMALMVDKIREMHYDL